MALFSRLPGGGRKPQIAVKEQKANNETITFQNVDFSKIIVVNVVFLDSYYYAFSEFVTIENGKVTNEKKSATTGSSSYITYTVNKTAGTLSFTTTRDGKFLTAWLTEIS